MRIQTFSIIAGSTACNGRCPFCVSRMTAPNGIQKDVPKVNWGNFDKACRIAQLAGVTTAMITGKGEPTLFPNQILGFLNAMRKYDFPLIELQTNGLVLNEKDVLGRTLESELHQWHSLGLSTVAISLVHHDAERNREIYCPYMERYIDVKETVRFLHNLGLSVRLSCVMIGGYVSTPGTVKDMISFAKDVGAEQLTFVPISAPTTGRENSCSEWVRKHRVTPDDLRAIQRFLDEEGTRLMELSHGAVVYDVGGQNACLSNCLTVKADATELRNLIFFPDGHLRYDWQYEGAIIL